MTTVTFLMEGNRIIGFDAQGHSGYAEAGEDIVCAAITSAIRLPGGLSEFAEHTSQTLMTGLMVYFAQLHDEFPDNIEVLEED